MLEYRCHIHFCKRVSRNRNFAVTSSMIRKIVGNTDNYEQFKKYHSLQKKKKKKKKKKEKKRKKDSLQRDSSVGNWMRGCLTQL